jgi:hypothetical protein
MRVGSLSNNKIEFWQLLRAIISLFQKRKRSTMLHKKNKILMFHEIASEAIVESNKGIIQNITQGSREKIAFGAIAATNLASASTSLISKLPATIHLSRFEN